MTLGGMASGLGADDRALPMKSRLSTWSTMKAQIEERGILRLDVTFPTSALTAGADGSSVGDRKRTTVQSRLDSRMRSAMAVSSCLPLAPHHTADDAPHGEDRVEGIADKGGHRRRPID